MVEDGRAVVGLGLRDDHDVVQEEVGVWILGYEDIGGEDVAGMKLAQNAWVLELVGHGHCVHKAGNCFMIQSRVAGGGVCGDNFAPEFIDLER
jgi:hypothetical protein